ncbi:hypothetical protein N9V24_01075 [Pseudomonadota bacterium]|nr:hypothetical protein [Pseudomonadota bacterium]
MTIRQTLYDNYPVKKSFMNEKDLLIFEVAAKIQLLIQKHDLKPSSILSLVNIVIDDKDDNLESIDFGQVHFSCTKYLDIEENFCLDFDNISSFLSQAKIFLPILRGKRLEDWPFLFLAQCQSISQFWDLPPSAILSVFGIFVMPEEDDWNHFNWKLLIKGVYIKVELNSFEEVDKN